jgi:hypothetical protein
VATCAPWVQRHSVRRLDFESASTLETHSELSPVLEPMVQFLSEPKPNLASQSEVASNSSAALEPAAEFLC